MEEGDLVPGGSRHVSGTPRARQTGGQGAATCPLPRAHTRTHRHTQTHAHTRPQWGSNGSAPACPAACAWSQVCRCGGIWAAFTLPLRQLTWRQVRPSASPSQGPVGDKIKQAFDPGALFEGLSMLVVLGRPRGDSSPGLGFFSQPLGRGLVTGCHPVRMSPAAHSSQGDAACSPVLASFLGWLVRVVFLEDPVTS